MKPNIQQKISIKNRRASFDYSLFEKFTAGIVLVGTEIKALREGKASLVDSFCYFRNGELFVKNLNISIYTEGNLYNHEPTRERKLLLNRQELNKLQKKLQDKGLTIIPTFLFSSEKGYAKLEIALAKGKKLFDKRDALKAKDVDRDLKRKFNN
ncbi:MAG: SsrA-binding protein SmpB [Bacteroidota bacterium]